jgi:DNA-binding transcriptional LysR family regulator
VRCYGTVIERGTLAKRGRISKDHLVSIGYSPRINLRLLSIVRNLSISERPEFKLAFISLHTGDQVQALLHGSVHAGLVTLPIKNESLVVKHLVRESLAVVMPESHPLTLKTELKARELNGQPVISIPRQLSPGFHDRLHTLFKRVGYKPNVVQEITTEEEALYMVREGMGIAFMKISAIPGGCPGIAYRRLRESSLIEETGIAYRRDNRSENIGRFIDFLQGRLRDLANDAMGEGTQGVQQHSDQRQLSLF